MPLMILKLLVGRVITAVITFAGRAFRALNPQGWIGLIACGLLAFLYIRAEGESRHWHKQSNRYEKLYRDEHSGRIADRKAYQEAQAQAAANNKAHVSQVEQQYQRNSDNEREAYLRDLARLRADRVRREGPAPQSAPNGASPSQDCTAAAGADGDGVQVPACRDLQEEAGEIELRLMHLQNYVEQLLKVDPNK